MRIYAFEHGKFNPGVMVVVAHTEAQARVMVRDQTGSPEEPELLNIGIALDIRTKGNGEFYLTVEDLP